MAQAGDAYWQFHCPECGFGDREFGYLLAAEEIHCLVCIEEDGRAVTLRRWLADESDQARLRGDLAAA